MAPKHLFANLVRLVWGDGRTIQLWQRIVKYTIGCTAAMIIAILPDTVNAMGLNTFLVPMAIVFAHPAQRMGLMMESLLMILVGGLLGLSWSLLGLWLSSLVVHTNKPAASTIRALFLLVAVLLHGFIRSASPRLFVFVLFMLIPCVMVLLGSADEVDKTLFTGIYYPLLAGAAVLIPTNLLVFPELSATFLGSATIEALAETVDTLNRATYWFVTPGGDSRVACGRRSELEPPGPGETAAARRIAGPRKAKDPASWHGFWSDFPNPFRIAEGPSRNWTAPLSSTTLAHLTDRKANLRTQLGRCKAAQEEANFELSVAPLPPSVLKPISTRGMSALVQNTFTLIGACENKFLVLETESHLDSKEHRGDRHGSSNGQRLDATVNLVCHGSDLLESILARIRQPVQEFQGCMQEAAVLLTSCLAHCFDVSQLPSGAPAPTGISLEEVDLRIDSFGNALVSFNGRASDELKKAAMDATGKKLDLMPRMETFLVSSFLLAISQAAEDILRMLRHSRALVEKRQARAARFRLWLPHHASVISWLLSGGPRDGMAQPEAAWKSILHENGTKAAPAADEPDSVSGNERVGRAPGDEEALPKSRRDEERANRSVHEPAPKESTAQRLKSWTSLVRRTLVDGFEAILASSNLAYALKFAVAMLLVCWPGFVTSWSGWYASVRGMWAPLQLILVFEVAIGASIFSIVVRLVGVVFGCVVAYVSYEIARGYRAVMIVVLVVGIVPSVYLQIATQYVKGGMISIVSIAVVALAAVDGSGTAYQSFYKRLVAFLIGSVAAIVVEAAIYPARARDRLVESLSASIRHIQDMQIAVAVGIDGPQKPDFRSPELHGRFGRARGKAQGALGVAESFLPFCLTEPRLKGSFRTLAPIYGEIIYVLHQIIDRMDGVIQLRRAYGSSILEDLHPKVYAYRRNMAAGVVLMLFSVNEALTTGLPLPQFMPSARIAELRLINRVREVLGSRTSPDAATSLPSRLVVSDGKVDEQTAQVITQRRFLSWNASIAGQMEVIEYLEELVELVKLLVGVNAFRSGMLERPTYKQYADQARLGNHLFGDSQSAYSGTTGSSRETGDDSVYTAAGESRRETSRGGPSAEGPERGSRSTEFTGVNGDDETEAIPRSLQRVGTRVWQKNAAVRRRGFPTEK